MSNEDNANRREKVDDYIANCIRKGGAGSKLLAERTAPTLRNSEHVRVIESGMNGVAGIRVPPGHFAVVHSISGDPRHDDIGDYSVSVIDRLLRQAWNIGATPLAIADVIDSNTGDLSLLERIIDPFVTIANHHKLPIMNGENAILGNRVREANVVGTMLGMIDSRIGSRYCFPGQPAKIRLQGTTYVLFDPQDHMLYMNSDGIGSKTELYERLLGILLSDSKFIRVFQELFGLQKFGRLIRDSGAMKLDDLMKIGAKAAAVSDVVEYRGHIPLVPLINASKKFSRYGLEYALQFENVGDRIRGYKDGAPALNVSGSSVSMLDDTYIKNPLKPSAGEYLIGVRGEDTPRSNGITSLRGIMENWLGLEWHDTEEGRLMLEFLAEPSTVFYPTFTGLVKKGLATSLYHLSGGSYDEKLARPLAKHGLYVNIKDRLPINDYFEELMHRAGDMPLRTALGKWAVGYEGFITTRNPEQAIAYLQKKGLKAEVVGVLEKRADNKTGVNFEYHNEYFSGKD